MYGSACFHAIKIFQKDVLKEIKNTPYNPEHVRSYYKNILQIKLYVKKLKFLSGVWLLGFWVSFVDFGVPGPRSRL